jgi:hypothetical protein
MSPAPSTARSNSTGPRTPEGKTRSSLNALRHGLTGRVVVLPHEDLNAYRAFCADLMKDLAPEGPLEHQFAQTFCDTQWRLNRARSIEDSMFALGHDEPAGDIDPGHPEVHAAMTAARVFRENSKAFVNLSLYEQRLQRTLKESLRQLQELQARRNQTNGKAETEVEQTQPNAASAAPRQFVYSTPEPAPETAPQTAPEATTPPHFPHRKAA